MPEARRPIRAITFDLDYTLWDLEGVLARAEARQHDYLAAHYPEAARRYTSADIHALRLRLYELHPELRHNVTELRRAALRQVARSCGYGEELVDAAFRVFLDARHEVVLYDDARPLLESLRGRYRLGVITNGNADVRRLDLGHCFDVILSPMDIGAAKPDRVIFEAACHRLGVEPEEAAHVGDEPEADVVGAANHGMTAVWINRAGQAWPEGVRRPPSVELGSLAELDRWLAQGRAQ